MRHPDPGQFLSGIDPRFTRPGNAVRQLVQLKRHVLSLYALLAANAGALAATHYDVAPFWLSPGLPAALIVLCAVRGLHWWRLDPEAQTDESAIRMLRLTTGLTIVLAVLFVGWAMALHGYGDPFEQGHVAIFVAVTVVGCIFCLTHLPIAAFLVAAIVMGSFVVHCVMTRNVVFIAIAINTTFVTIVMVRILAHNFLAFLDLAESQERAEQLVAANERLALTDNLTDLPNRRFFFQTLHRWYEKAREAGQGFGLAIFDLDRFKPINDTFGHAAGDRVLAETGRRLAQFGSPDVVVTRLGGDEFGVLMRAEDGPASTAALCDRICETLRAPILLGETQVTTGCTGGLTLLGPGSAGAEALFEEADYALYHAKETERGATTIFSPTHAEAIRAERAIETALRTADLAAEMELHYQPIMDLHENRVVQVEGLARWTSATLGRVPPDRFISAAERYGLIHPITILLFGKAIEDARSLPEGIGLSFNLSSHDLASPETMLRLLAMLGRSGFDPGRLTFELTETALMRDYERVSDSIRLLRSAGIRIALDDFGTGYSSLGYVHRLDFDKIKIDRSFVSDIGSQLGQRVVATVLDLCANLGLDGVAEGVETPGQLAALRRQGCRYVQGYLIGKPMRMADLLATLDRPDTRIRASA